VPLTTEEGLGPGDFVLDGDPAPSSPKRSILKVDRKRAALPVIAHFFALEQQIILVKTRSESV